MDEKTLFNATAHIDEKIIDSVSGEDEDTKPSSSCVPSADTSVAIKPAKRRKRLVYLIAAVMAVLIVFLSVSVALNVNRPETPSIHEISDHPESQNGDRSDVPENSDTVLDESADEASSNRSSGEESENDGSIDRSSHDPENNESSDEPATSDCETSMNDTSEEESDAPEDQGYSKGLSFGLSKDKTSAYLSGIGTCTDKDIVVQPKYKSAPVTSVKKNAFDNCDINSVVLPNTVTKIDDNAFSNCPSLKTVVLPGGIIAVPSYAFLACKSLESIVLPDNVEAIGEYAFADCTSLKTVVFPKSLKKIGISAFHNCISLNSFELPKKLKSIGISAFENCRSITELVIPDSVTDIGGYAFATCFALKTVTVGSGFKKTEAALGVGAFFACCALESVIIREGVETVASNMFANCTSLTSVQLPESLKAISSRAFYDCSSLLEITVPKNVWLLDKEWIELRYHYLEVKVHFADPFGWRSYNSYPDNFIDIDPGIADPDIAFQVLWDRRYTQWVKNFDTAPPGVIKMISNVFTQEINVYSREDGKEYSFTPADDQLSISAITDYYNSLDITFDHIGYPDDSQGS
ncbi:MAG: leucine-rich repeat protein, partial [Clostridia bacterium]|nr:leucine-rich repeat protein [Clostridia bacterium]